MPYLVAAIFAFFSALISRIGQWFITAYFVGTLKTAALYAANIAFMAGIVFTLVKSVNDILVQMVNNLSPIAQMIITPIAAMLPTNLPFLVSAVLTYYALSIYAHVALEISKFKARWAENAMKSFKA